MVVWWCGCGCGCGCGTRVATPPACRSAAPPRRAPGFKSLLCTFLRMLPRVRRITRATDRPLSSDPYAPAPGPCNAARDVGHHPTWQGRLGSTKPHWGHRLCASGMPARALRALKPPKLLLVLLRAIWEAQRADSLGSGRTTNARCLSQV
jgi:hypothetical protein